jgi:CO/xanthine dehydrogenase Mo-binding subunit
MAYDKVRYLGDVIAIVAAESQEEANAAAELVTADYEVLPVLGTPRKALESEHLINEKCPKNICGEVVTYKGDIEKGLAESDVVIKTRYNTGFVEHAYIEPESVTAIPSRMRPELTILGSLQAPYNARISIHWIFPCRRSSCSPVPSGDPSEARSKPPRPCRSAPVLLP